MERRLFSEYAGLYASNAETPNVIRLRIRMRDLIDSDALRRALDETAKRYPYFCVELRRKENGEWVFVDNPRPVVLAHSERGAELNAEASNYHPWAVLWHDNWLALDISHALTDGAGSYELLRTLLYCYCSHRYRVNLDGHGIRLAGEHIPEEEWLDPLETADTPDKSGIPDGAKPASALDLRSAAHLEDDRQQAVYSIALSESELMRFSRAHDGSPATVAALFLSRAIASLFPESRQPIRVGLFVNWRTALGAPGAHQCLVGTALLEYKEAMRAWTLERQATAYRGMVFAQTREESVLPKIASEKAFAAQLRACRSDEERLRLTNAAAQAGKGRFSAAVSYVGKADWKEAEAYIREMRTLTPATSSPLLIELCAVNGAFQLDVIQRFRSPIFVNALLKELEENGVVYDLRDVTELRLPNFRLPWSE